MHRIVPDMSAEDYFKDPSISRGDILGLMVSYEHWLASKQKKNESTEAMIFGRALHEAVLEPDIFKANYIQKPQFDRRTKAGKEGYEQFLLENPGKTLLSREDYEDIMNMKALLYSNPQSRRLLEHSQKEVSIFWEDPRTGIPCKMRADGISLEHKFIIDLKSTQKATIDSFTKSVFSMRYDIQAAFYLSGINALPENLFQDFIFIAIETTSPYGIAFYELTPKALDFAYLEFSRALDYYLACKSGEIENTGYSYDIQTIDIPSYMIRKVM